MIWKCKSCGHCRNTPARRHRWPSERRREWGRTRCHHRDTPSPSLPPMASALTIYWDSVFASVRRALAAAGGQACRFRIGGFRDGWDHCFGGERSLARRMSSSERHWVEEDGVSVGWRKMRGIECLGGGRGAVGETSPNGETVISCFAATVSSGDYRRGRFLQLLYDGDILRRSGSPAAVARERPPSLRLAPFHCQQKSVYDDVSSEADRTPGCQRCQVNGRALSWAIPRMNWTSASPPGRRLSGCGSMLPRPPVGKLHGPAGRSSATPGQLREQSIGIHANEPLDQSSKGGSVADHWCTWNVYTY